MVSREHYRGLQQLRGLPKEVQRALDHVIRWSKQFPMAAEITSTIIQQFIDDGTVVVPIPLAFEFASAGLGNTTLERVLDSAPVGDGGGPHPTTSEGRGQKVMVMPGRFLKAIIRIRDVLPGSGTWRVRSRVNEAYSGFDVTLNFAAAEREVTVDMDLQVSQNDRISISSLTSAAFATVSAPFVTMLFFPDEFTI